MILIDAKELDYRSLNNKLREADDDCTLIHCCGQRFIAAGMSDKSITISGVPGNALGAYLNGASIMVQANAQDAVGDTMNAGQIIVHGSIGDAAGYAMRGGKIFVKGDAGYRAGIHMKAYQDKVPVMVIGGAAGSFLGEYQAAASSSFSVWRLNKSALSGIFPVQACTAAKCFCARIANISNFRVRLHLIPLRRMNCWRQSPSFQNSAPCSDMIKMLSWMRPLQ